jgi:two-component system OmpR family sensor kinase
MRDLRVMVAVTVAVPLVLGGVASVIWAVAGGGPSFYVIGRLTWVPALVGALLALVAGVILIVRELERRRTGAGARRLLAEDAQRQRRLLARLDHELKNPIQGILAALADEPSDRQHASIEAQVGRLTSLLGDLRKIGEVENTDLEPTAIDPTALVEEVVASTRELPGADERRITVALPRAPRPLPMLVGDEDLLFLALFNVVSNAVKYSGPGDAIEVRGRTAEDQVVIEVADTGRGIRPEDLSLVWEELGRAGDARGIEGSGLGLPMVRAIILRHGGSTRLESWHGEGTTVTVGLPLAPERLPVGFRHPRV